MAVRARIIHGPITWKRAPVAIGNAQVIGISINVRVAQARPHPLGLLIPVRRQREVIVLDRGIFFERLLCAKNAPSGEDRHKAEGESEAKTHVRHWSDKGRTATSE